MCARVCACVRAYMGVRMGAYGYIHAYIQVHACSYRWTRSCLYGHAGCNGSSDVVTYHSHRGGSLHARAYVRVRPCVPVYARACAPAYEPVLGVIFVIL